MHVPPRRVGEVQKGPPRRRLKSKIPPRTGGGTSCSATGEEQRQVAGIVPRRTRRPGGEVAAKLSPGQLVILSNICARYIAGVLSEDKALLLASRVIES